jgi:DNA invertase Pin-like site-specific DNA recombinase
MDEISGTNLTGNENDTLGGRQKPKDGRARTSPLNAKLGGRPKGSGVKQVDWGKYQRLGLDGLPMETIARQLGVSVRTFKRRKRQRQLDDSPM